VFSQVLIQVHLDLSLFLECFFCSIYTFMLSRAHLGHKYPCSCIDVPSNL
jgi:hypothetical protein